MVGTIDAKDTTGLAEAIDMNASATVFLSYNHRDRESVLAVDQWLRNRRVLVYFDDRDFIAGQDLEQQIVGRIQASDKVVCFYSKHSQDRPWVQFEQRVSRIHERRGSRSVLVYFRLDDSPLPFLDSERLAINAYSTTFENACQKLLAAVLERPVTARKVDLKQYDEFPPWMKDNRTLGDYTDFVKKKAEERPHTFLAEVREDIEAIMALPEDKLLAAVVDLLQERLADLEHEAQVAGEEMETQLNRRAAASTPDEMGNATFLVLLHKLDQLAATATQRVIKRGLRAARYLTGKNDIQTILLPMLIFKQEEL